MSKFKSALLLCLVVLVGACASNPSNGSGSGKAHDSDTPREQRH